MRKKWIAAVGLSVFMVTAGAGCGAKEQDSQVAAIEQEPLEDGSEEQNAETEEETEKESADRQQETGKPESGETEQLDGNVRGIGDNGIVIIKVKTEELEDGVSLAIQPASGNETAEDYVDVNFTDDTTFELHVVKNGGVNPDEDVTVKEASISDIVGDMSVTLEGYYDGEVFVARKVVLYEFV
ncbi:MAG: hypothetical protein HFI45_08180 [Lachnospiraceae bacterium]|nr:hypothetical protein [Lachnospiraceae bacterium]